MEQIIFQGAVFRQLFDHNLRQIITQTKRSLACILRIERRTHLM